MPFANPSRATRPISKLDDSEDSNMDKLHVNQENTPPSFLDEEALDSLTVVKSLKRGQISVAKASVGHRILI